MISKKTPRDAFTLAASNPRETPVTEEKIRIGNRIPTFGDNAVRNIEVSSRNPF